MLTDSRPGTDERRRIVVRGTVQGVGYRPFVHRLARRHGLAGFVRNDGEGVTVEAEGTAAALDAFTDDLRSEAPPLARVARLGSEPVPAEHEGGFRIAPSSGAAAGAPIPADVATCEACLRELWDPADRRHRYPFINCSDCGPRFTIVLAPPYDRARTTMASFAICERCAAEYRDPDDRRFGAEPIACPDCGPRLSLEATDGTGTQADGERALAAAAGLLSEGRIVAVKGLGGYHLACLAGEEDAVARLRRRKRRERKPLAVMSPRPQELARLSERELELLRSPARPVVLAPAAAGGSLAPSVAPGCDRVGLMLPYTPLHHLLCAEVGRPLVMTSGNRSDEPIATADEDARERLGPIADALLLHDRPIHRRCEDSVVFAGFPVRRSRGHAPSPLGLPRRPAAGGRPRRSRTIVGAGAELKATFCIATGGMAFLSPHLGDLDSPLAHTSYRSDLELYLEMLGARPELIAHDLHPDYLSTRWALEQEGVELLGVQHHHAHAAACLAEHDHTGTALALVFDGTGLGADGTLWGGELLRCDLAAYERLAHLRPVPLPGGERAIAEPWRMAASYLEAAGLPVADPRWPRVRQSLAVNAPTSSGMGRLFDAAAALLGLGEAVSYEGQAAIELERLAGLTPAEGYPCAIEDGVIGGPELIAAAHEDLAGGRPREQVAAAVHEGVARAAAAACAAAAEPGTAVALSGGCFQNLRLLDSVTRRLRELGLRPLSHRAVPPNDAGISYGQAAVAAAGGG